MLRTRKKKKKKCYKDFTTVKLYSCAEIYHITRSNDADTHDNNFLAIHRLFKNWRYLNSLTFLYLLSYYSGIRCFISVMIAFYVSFQLSVEGIRAFHSHPSFSLIGKQTKRRIIRRNAALNYLIVFQSGNSCFDKPLLRK